MAFNLVLRCAVADALLIVHLQSCRQHGVILTQDQYMVKVFQDGRGSFLNLIAGENHIDARFNGVLYLDYQCTGVTVEIWGFAFKTVKPVGVLQIQFGDAFHYKISVLFFIWNPELRYFVIK